MLKTPIGMRYLEGHEKAAFLYAAKNFADFILANAIAEEMGKMDDIRIAMKGEGAFVKLSFKSQLVALHETIFQAVDPWHENEITQIKNSAMECVYAWLFYEIKSENERFVKMEGQCGREASMLAYHAWQEQLCNFQFSHRSNSIAEWEKVVDNLATRLIFDNRAASAFKLGVMEAKVTPEKYDEAQEYFRML